MEVHDLCKIFPEMTAAEFDDLCTSVAKIGIVDPIITYQGKVLDGRNRYRAALHLGCEAPMEEWDGRGKSPLEFVVSRNLSRRNLTPSQRAAIALDVKEELEAVYRERMVANGKSRAKAAKNEFGKSAKLVSRGGNSRKEAAALMNVSDGYVAAAQRIQAKSPATFEAVKSGRMTIPQAKRELQLTRADPPKPTPPDSRPEPESKPAPVPTALPVEPAPEPPSRWWEGLKLTGDPDADAAVILAAAGPDYAAHLTVRLSSRLSG